MERRIRRRPSGRELEAAPPPSVSVIIPCFNYARFLESAVSSALEQEGVSVQVLIVDDGSTDGSLEVARRLAAGCSAVSVLAHAHNQGPVATFNDGLDRASGEFLVRLDADDMLTPGALARAAALARCYPSVGLVYGHPLHFRGEPPTPRSGVRSWTVWPGHQWLADRCRSGTSVITSPEAFMRSSIVKRVGGQQPLPHSHDMEMWLRIAAFADVAYIEGPDQALHREHPDSLSSRVVGPTADLRVRNAAFEQLFAGPAGSLPDADRLRWLAARALAREALRDACHRYDRGKASDASVAALVAFARAVEPSGAALGEWKGLRRRVRLGAERVKRRPWYVAAALRRRALWRSVADGGRRRASTSAGTACATRSYRCGSYLGEHAAAQRRASIARMP